MHVCAFLSVIHFIAHEHSKQWINKETPFCAYVLTQFSRPTTQNMLQLYVLYRVFIYTPFLQLSLRKHRQTLMAS